MFAKCKVVLSAKNETATKTESCTLRKRNLTAHNNSVTWNTFNIKISESENHVHIMRTWLPACHSPFPHLKWGTSIWFLYSCQWVTAFGPIVLDFLTYFWWYSSHHAKTESVPNTGRVLSAETECLPKVLISHIWHRNWNWNQNSVDFYCKLTLR